MNGNSRLPVRVGFFIDGGESYGVLEYTRLLLANIDRRKATPVGLFVGPGRGLDILAPLCEETAVLMGKCLLPLSDATRRRWDPAVLSRKLLLAAACVPRLAAAIRRLGIDVVDVNYYPHHILAGLACRLTHRPCIWHWHGPYAKDGISASFAEWGMRNLASAIPCISNFVRSSLPRSVQGKTSVIYNGVDACRIQQLQQHGALRRILGIESGQKLVAVFGAISPRKGHEYLVRAAPKLIQAWPRTLFVIIGNESEQIRARIGLTAKLKRLRSELGLEQNVLFQGYLPEAWKYMNDCDVICMPTVPIGKDSGEGFGLVMAEAMAAGVPVVATSCGAPPEIIEDGRSGLLVPPADADALAEAILRLLRDREFGRRIAVAGRERIRNHFDIRYTVAGMQHLYDRLTPRIWNAV